MEGPYIVNHGRRNVTFAFIIGILGIEVWTLASTCLGKRSEAIPHTRGAPSMQTTPHGLELTGRVEIGSGEVAVNYSVRNRTNEDVYILDVLPSRDPKTSKPIADPSAIYVFWGGEGIATLLKGIAPLPIDRSVSIRIIPFSTKLSPEEQIERSIRLQLPLAESSPYYGPLEKQHCSEVQIQRIRLTIDVLRSSVEGFGAEVSAQGPGIYRVWGKATVAQAERLISDFRVKNVTMLKRNDKFSRPE